MLTPRADDGASTPQPLSSATAGAVDAMLEGGGGERHGSSDGLDNIPLLDSQHVESSGLHSVLEGGVRERK